MALDGRSKLADASMSLSVRRDVGDAGQDMLFYDHRQALLLRQCRWNEVNELSKRLEKERASQLLQARPTFVQKSYGRTGTHSKR